MYYQKPGWTECVLDATRIQFQYHCSCCHQDTNWYHKSYLQWKTGKGNVKIMRKYRSFLYLLSLTPCMILYQASQLSHSVWSIITLSISLMTVFARGSALQLLLRENIKVVRINDLWIILATEFFMWHDMPFIGLETSNCIDCTVRLSRLSKHIHLSNVQLVHL